MGTTAAAMFMALVFVVVINIPLNSATICTYKTMKLSSSYTGYIVSPGYPSPYPSENCTIWVFKGLSGMQVTIRFQDIDIPSYSGLCLNDLVRIGPLNEHTYCGNVNNLRNFDPYTAEFTSEDNFLYIVFNSTSVGNKGRGFRLFCQFTNNSDIAPIITPTISTTTFTIAPTSTVFYSMEEMNSDENLCNFIINDDQGYIMTNREVLECLRTTGKATWQIFYPSVGNTNFKCKIFFDECNVPYPGKLTIYDGYLNEDSKLGEYSDRLCPNFLISTSSSLFLEYIRNDAATLPSLNLMFMKIASDGNARNYNYETTKTHDYESTQPPRYRYIPSENPANHYSSECIFHLSDQSGEINSANIASLVQKSGFCTWLLHFASTDGQVVTYTLNLERFQVSAESTFVVYDGADMSAPVLGSFLEPSKSLISSQSSIFIYFNPGINVHLVEVADFFTIEYQANFQCSESYLACGYGEHACYRNSDRCDNIWHCPLHGGDERGCFFNCPQEFSCGFTTSVCYSESERCNGKAFCSNKMDELNCEKAQCSSDKGLFLCRSGKCIFENMRCDRLHDCEDNSDEDNCSAYTSTLIIIAAVSGSLLCALMVVLSMGCICKIYPMRNRHRQERHHETPLTRHLAEMLRHRAPPPPYHEAMLTSRPYSEADVELLDHSEQQETFGLLNPGYHDDMAPTSITELTQRNHHQDNGHSLQDQALTEGQHQASASRNGSESLIEVGTLALFSEDLENDDPYWGTTGHDLPPDDSELPPYSETDPSGSTSTGSYQSIFSDESCHDDSWQRSFANGTFAGDNPHSRSASELLIQMEIMPSDGAQHSASALNVPHVARNTDGMKSVPERHQMEVINGGNSDLETMSTSTRLSLDSTSDKDMNDTENDDVREDVDMIDSDSECILLEDNTSDNNSESDTFILAH